MRHKIKPSLLVIIAGNLICPILFLILTQTISRENYVSIIIDNAAALSTIMSITSTTLFELMPIFFKTGILLFGIQLFNLLVLKGGNYSERGFKNFTFNVSMLLPTVVVSILISLFLNIPFIDSTINHICDIRATWTSFLGIFSSETFLIGLQNIALTIWGIIRLAIFFVVTVYPIAETIAVLLIMLLSALLILIISVITWIFGYGFGTVFNGFINSLNATIAFFEGFGLVFGAIATIICFITIDNIFVAIFKKINIETYSPQYKLAQKITFAILGK
ncbi:MAG: hypothetical protein IJ995_04165 [Clostridia bacterium]|nr:hypothetical protein [Clostridia bacterium]